MFTHMYTYICVICICVCVYMCCLLTMIDVCCFWNEVNVYMLYIMSIKTHASNLCSPSSLRVNQNSLCFVGPEITRIVEGGDEYNHTDFCFLNSIRIKILNLQNVAKIEKGMNLF